MEHLLFFTLDEIEYSNGKASEKNILGGAGTYAALGARLAAGSLRADRVGWIVDQGSDFPPELKDLIDRWQTSCRFRINLNRLSTRAWNGYGPNELRSFRYLTPKKRLETFDLSDVEVYATSFHMVCSPTRCVELVKSIKARRRNHQVAEGPFFVWEPVPDLCTPEELNNLQIASDVVNIVSPNGDELAEFFSGDGEKMSRSEMAHALLPEVNGYSLRTPVVVRDGADGSRLYWNNRELHFPAFHRDTSKVVDPTGGGNTYLGALAIGLTGEVEPASFGSETSTSEGRWNIFVPELVRHILAILHATIAASFAIEQVGVPHVDDKDPGVWNGCRYMDRFEEYLEREQSYLIQQLKGIS